MNCPTFCASGWGAGKPEVSQILDDPFRGLAMGIKFQGTTAQAIGDRFVRQSLIILGVLSVLMIGGLVLTYRSVNKHMALARLKSDFVSNVSHELRTPLALIRLYAETLELGRINTQEKKLEYYSIIRKESERLRISPELLATRRDIEQLVFTGKLGAPAEGWRREVIGQALLELAAKN